MQSPILQSLLTLSHELGREDRGLAILSEGNTSAFLGDKTFLIKASGASLAQLKPEETVECRYSPLVPLLENQGLSDQELAEGLKGACVDIKARRPSVEVVLHAWLLSQPGVKFVGHTHPVFVNQILCSTRAREFSLHRLFAGEVVHCGAASVFIPYVESGLKLAQAARAGTDAFLQREQRPPRLILLQNHGIIALGGGWQSVFAATMMAEKAARIFLGASALGGPVFLSLEDVARIDSSETDAFRAGAAKA